MAILSFKNRGTEDIFHGVNSPQARRTLPKDLWAIAQRKLDMLNAATTLEDLRRVPGNRLEKLSGDRRGQYSIRINDRYRICFVWSENGAERVEIVDYHG